MEFAHTSQYKAQDQNLPNNDIFGASTSTTEPISNIKISSSGDQLFNYSLGDSGYTSTANHQTPHNSTHFYSSASSHQSITHSKLERICEENENNSLNTSPITISPAIATPTTASIRGLNALQLNSPRTDRAIIRSPIKRQLSMAHNSINLDSHSVTPHKMLKVIEERDDIENMDYTPKKVNNNSTSRALSNNSNYKRLQNKRMLGNDAESFVRVPLSPIHGKKTHTNDLENQVRRNSNVTSQRSLSTSTPKFVYEDENLTHITKSGSPLKKRRLIKKFQSFSPIKSLNNQENIATKFDDDIDHAKKRLIFLPNSADNKLKFTKKNTLIRQKALTQQKSDSFENQSNYSKLEAIVEENVPDKSDLNLDSSSEMVVREGPDDSIFFCSFSGVPVQNQSFDFKHKDLIDAPIKIGNPNYADTQIEVCFETPEKNIIPSKRSSSSATPPAKKLQQNNTNSFSDESQMKVKINSSICDAFVDDDVAPNIGDSQISSYFDSMKNRLFEESSIESSNEIHSGYYKTRDSLELITEDVEKFKSQNQSSPQKLKKVSYNPILTTPVKTPIKSIFNNAEYEKSLILKREIPKTPSKLIKRSNSFKTTNYKKIPRTSYEGIERLNIFAHLQGHDIVIDKIFRLLNDEDLARFALVSKSCYNIVHKNIDASKRRIRYLKESSQGKENIVETGSSKKDCLRKASKAYRLPLAKTNCMIEKSKSRSSSESPPKSPSRFNENQKVSIFLNIISLSLIYILCTSISKL